MKKTQDTFYFIHDRHAAPPGKEYAPDSAVHIWRDGKALCGEERGPEYSTTYVDAITVAPPPLGKLCVICADKRNASPVDDTKVTEGAKPSGWHKTGWDTEEFDQTTCHDGYAI